MWEFIYDSNSIQTWDLQRQGWMLHSERDIGNKLHTTSSAQWLRTQSHLKRVFTCVFSYVPDALKWIWNIPSPDKWAELLLGVLSENRLHSRSPEIIDYACHWLTDKLTTSLPLSKLESDQCLPLSLTHWRPVPASTSFLLRLQALRSGWGPEATCRGFLLA